MNLRGSNSEKSIALLGKRDFPTDGVADYCDWLQQALTKQGHEFAILEMPWSKVGWLQAFQWLWDQSQHWQGTWVVVQYTAFAWSKRGLPFAFLLAVLLLRWRGVKLAVIYHDTQGFPGDRWIDRLRRTIQESIMRLSYGLADRVLTTIEFSRMPWLPTPPGKAFLLPVGSNVPEPAHPPVRVARGPGEPKTILVFGITGEPHTSAEVERIADPIRQAAAQVSGLRLIASGRGSLEAEERLRQALTNYPVEIEVLGLISAERIAELLLVVDVLLFVRGNISSGRTSVVVGIAAGLPIVGYSGPHTGFPITEAGIMLVPPGDRDQLGQDLTAVLTNPALWQSLHQKNLEAQQQYFAWDTIATQYLRALYDDAA
ncbi:MAG: hypothetical protein SFW36_05035 [Leptolyngbyaceae cyanobacterium bins.59]|nr:hypothetical protein [Leptolyngbyaceae cyanobacterium bins.59]